MYSVFHIDLGQNSRKCADLYEISYTLRQNRPKSHKCIRIFEYIRRGERRGSASTLKKERCKEEPIAPRCCFIRHIHCPRHTNIHRTYKLSTHSQIYRNYTFATLIFIVSTAITATLFSRHPQQSNRYTNIHRTYSSRRTHKFTVTTLSQRSYSSYLQQSPPHSLSRQPLQSNRHIHIHRIYNFR